MANIPRRTIKELEFIYDRDPGRSDVYVEGPFDASVIQWFTTTSGLANVAVYPIESIEISDKDLAEEGLRVGNMGRVFFLAAALSRSAAKRAACVIDADFSILRQENPCCPPLFRTDYACMEMYYFSPPNVSKFLAINCNKTDWPVQKIMHAIASVLQEFFLFRFTNDELEWGLDWLDRIVCLSVDGWEIKLDMDSYVTRLLNKNNRASRKNEFLRYIEEHRQCLTDDPRNQMNGHDLTALLSWYLRIKGVSGSSCRHELVEACMRMTLDHKTLTGEQMFQKLTNYLTAQVS